MRASSPARATEHTLFARPTIAVLTVSAVLATTAASPEAHTITARPASVVAVADLRDDLRAQHEVRSDRARRAVVVQVPTPVKAATPAKRVVKVKVPKRTAKRAPVRRVKAKARATRRRAPSAPVTYVGSGRAGMVVAFVLAQVGDRYVHGATGPDRWDCSGLTMTAWARAGVRLPHNADAQRGYGRAVTRAQLLPGDLIFYPGHVGVAVGGGLMVAAATQRSGVKLQKIYGSPSAYRRVG